MAQVISAADLNRQAREFLERNRPAADPAWAYSIMPVTQSVNGQRVALTVDVAGENGVSEKRGLWARKGPNGQFDQPVLMSAAQAQRVREQEDMIPFDQNLRDRLILARGLRPDEVDGYLRSTGLARRIEEGGGRVSIHDLSAGQYFKSDQEQMWMDAGDRPIIPQPIQVFTIRETAGANAGKQVVISTDDPRYATARRATENDPREGLQGYMVNRIMVPGEVVNPAFTENGGDVTLMFDNTKKEFVNARGQIFHEGAAAVTDDFIQTRLAQSERLIGATSVVRSMLPAMQVSAATLAQSGIGFVASVQQPAQQQPAQQQQAQPQPAAAPKPAPPPPAAPPPVAQAPVDPRAPANQALVDSLKLGILSTDSRTAENQMYDNVKKIFDAATKNVISPAQMDQLINQYNPGQYEGTPLYGFSTQYKKILSDIKNDPALYKSNDAMNRKIDVMHADHLGQVPAGPRAQALNQVYGVSSDPADLTNEGKPKTRFDPLRDQFALAHDGLVIPKELRPETPALENNADADRNPAFTGARLG